MLSAVERYQLRLRAALARAQPLQHETTDLSDADLDHQWYT